MTEVETILESIGAGLPDAHQYKRLTEITWTVPEARKLAQMDPFSSAYRSEVMDLYLSLRGRAAEGYVASRDEATSAKLPDHLWSGLIPWSFQDAKAISEHLLAWGNICRHLNLPPGGSVLEYGPGSGQLLLMLSRMGYRACGVDIDDAALEAIRAQSRHLDLTVETECAEFGNGFLGERFDCILFFEAFHHAFEFFDLLVRLHDHLSPTGQIVLCGEPILPGSTDTLPYPWGPRLDALSIFCIRRFGWMELGFEHSFFLQAAELTGWEVQFYPFPECGRATLYVLVPLSRGGLNKPPFEPHRPMLQETQLLAELASLKASTSWRITAPLRRLKEFLRKRGM